MNNGGIVPEVCVFGKRNPAGNTVAERVACGMVSRMSERAPHDDPRATLKLDAPSADDEAGEGRTVRLKLPEAVAGGSLEDSTVHRQISAALDAQYDVLHKIGGGGMGVVYLARDRRLGRHVAVKRLNRDALLSEPLRERFMREAQAIAALNHIHIVHLYALGEDHQGPYIVMEYVPGPKADDAGKEPAPPWSLADRVSREGPLPLDVALELILKIGGAIRYAHERDVIHRDLKPSNVLMDASGEPKVVDFGLARVSSDHARPLTMPGERMLSLGYGAPEQEADASLTDGRVDVYGLGALLYFCVTGKNPRYFRPNDVAEVLRMPVLKALETSKEKRWASVAAFMEALTLIQSPRASGISTSKTTWRCKWCDTANPVVVKYCGECGWDGGIECPECGSESRFGIQFCGVCGADGKAYEAASRLLQDLEAHRQRRDFSTILQREKQIATFNAKGSKGRRIIERISELGQEAGAALRRRVALAAAIEREFVAGHYEHVRDYIVELHEVSQDRPYEDMAKKLDRLILDRDIARLHTMIGRGEWRFAARFAAQLAEGAGHDNAEVRRLRERVRARLLSRRVVRAAAALLVVVLAYVFAAAPIYRFANGRPGPGFYFVFGPAKAIHHASPLSPVLLRYARLWGAEEMFESLKPAT